MVSDSLDFQMFQKARNSLTLSRPQGKLEIPKFGSVLEDDAHDVNQVGCYPGTVHYVNVQAEAKNLQN